MDKIKAHFMQYKTIATILILFLAIGCSQTQKLDRSKMPEPGKAPKVKIGDYKSFKLDNGLTVFVVQDKSSPMVSYNLEIDRKPIKEGEKAGLTDVFGSMLGTATENRTKEELNEAIDFIGADLYTFSKGFYASALHKHKEKLLTLASDVVINAKFKGEELKKKKKQIKSSIEASQNSPGAIASRVFDQLLYGADHPYGEIQTTETIDRITLEDIKSYYQQYFDPSQAYLAVVGNTSKKEIKPIIEKHFGEWKSGGNVPEKDYEKPTPPKQNTVAVVNRSDAAQSTLRIGHPVELQLGNPDYFAARVANTILGGGAFRLFNNLREKHAYTYGAYSNISTDPLVGNFTATADVRNNATDSAIMQILKEMRKIRNKPVKQEELERAQNYISGNFAINLEDSRTVAEYAINKAKYDLPDDYYKNYLKNINNVTQEDVKKAANKYIKPDSSHILVVGKAFDFMGKLDKFGPVTYYDKYGNKTEKPKMMEAPAGMSSKDVINKYLEARGGKDRLEKLDGMKLTYSATIQGNPITVTQYKKRPDMMKNVTQIQGMERKQLYDGEKGYAVSMRGKQQITGKQLESLKINARMFYLNHLDELNIEAELKGIVTFNGKEAYKVVFKPKQGNSWSEYFSTETHLKIAEKRTRNTPQGEQTQTTYYGDYKSKDGIKFPGTITQSMGPRKFELTLDKIKLNPELSKEDFQVKD